jgi:hypothetical protein
MGRLSGRRKAWRNFQADPIVRLYSKCFTSQERPCHDIVQPRGAIVYIEARGVR